MVNIQCCFPCFLVTSSVIYLNLFIILLMSTDSVSNVFFILQSEKKKTTHCKLFVDHVLDHKIITNKVKKFVQITLIST